MRRAFTLMEILVVLAVVAVLAGLALGGNREQDKGISVKTAADELAAVLRETRERAIKSRQVYAVVFNITNAPGSSGKVLNNRSGGHWYRVIGPTSGSQNWTFQVGFPPYFQRQFSGMGGSGGGTRAQWNIPSSNADNPIRLFLESVAQTWIGEPHLLPKRKVRFLALNDQDNGNVCERGGTYPETYPRPWFGTWDETTKRIYPWGGYDPEMPMTNQTGNNSPYYVARSIGGRTTSHTGFFYEGYDGAISGCVQPSDRLVLDDTNGDGSIIIDSSAPDISDDPTKRYALWKAGEPRPLINGAWQDSMILFNPDGTVWTSWMRMRHAYAYRHHRTDYLCYDPTLNSGDAGATAPAGHFALKDLAPFDMCNRIVDTGGTYLSTLAAHPEASDFHALSGFYYITLAADVSDDRDTFPTVEDYLRQLSPCYRVGISPYGEVKVLRVRTTPQVGKTLDTTITGNDWNSMAITNVSYQNGILTNADGSPRGKPVVDNVTAEMLRKRTWWWQ